MQILDFNESPLFMQLNPAVVVTSKELPISLYESIIDIVDGSPTFRFTQAAYKIETGEAERLAVDHVAHATNVESATSSTLTAHLVTQRNAIKMLHARIKLLGQYIADVEAGVVPRDHNIVREIGSLCNRLPTIDNTEFKQEFLMDYNDVLLGSYLSILTKGTNQLSDLVEKSEHPHTLLEEKKRALAALREKIRTLEEKKQSTDDHCEDGAAAAATDCQPTGATAAAAECQPSFHLQKLTKRQIDRETNKNTMKNAYYKTCTLRFLVIRKVGPPPPSPSEKLRATCGIKGAKEAHTEEGCAALGDLDVTAGPDNDCAEGGADKLDKRLRWRRSLVAIHEFDPDIYVEAGENRPNEKEGNQSGRRSCLRSSRLFQPVAEDPDSHVVEVTKVEFIPEVELSTGRPKRVKAASAVVEFGRRGLKATPMKVSRSK
ncbi:COP9 signalosome complex subunit 6 [Irineochytrium annulatum]|nr:COP9 signalosome complex subunit 6 [Irineochytrium annulatum]